MAKANEKVHPIVTALRLITRGENAVQRVLVEECSTFAKDRNTIGLTRMVQAVDSYCSDWKAQAIKRYLKDVVKVAIIDGTVKTLPGMQYDKGWLDTIRDTLWTKGIKSVKEWSDPYENLVTQAATGILMGAVSWGDLVELYTVKTLRSIKAKVDDHKVQLKVANRVEKLGHPPVDIDALKEEFNQVMAA